MGKKNKNRPNQSSPPQGRPPLSTQPALTELAAKLEAAQAITQKVEKEIPENIPRPVISESSAVIEAKTAAPSPSDLLKMLTSIEKLNVEAERNNDRAKKWCNDAQSLEVSWNKKTKEVEIDLKSRKETLLNDIKNAEIQLQNLKDTHSAEDRGLQTKREELIKLQADAVAGFIAERAELFSGLEQEIRKYSTRYLEQDRKIQEVLQASERDLEAKQNKLKEDKRLAEENLQKDRSSFESEKRQIQWLREDIEQEKSDWKSRVTDEVRKGVAENEAEFSALKTANAELRTKISQLEDARKSVGNRSASDMAIEIQNLNATIGNLESKLANAPGIEERNRAKLLVDENDRLSQRLEQIQQENQALHLRAGKASIGVAELESLRDQRAAWETRELGYRARLDELKSDIEEYTAKVNEKDVFPACSDMDRDKSLQKPPVIRRTDDISLKVFASEVRQLIGSTGLFYRPEDIRSFIGGLAAFRLHILQGISGTGKTSLPLAFAEVMQWGSHKCEVQSGWRDRNDLLGYFNTFEKKFYESDFLKALYKASTPAYEHLPFLIVLDEMNLSHPEHYFADFLSVLEDRRVEKSVSLPNAPLADNGPDGLIDKGRRLPVPANVWFIGTANQDETTKDFADKTYDRAHIMEFPRHREQFKPDLPNILPGKISSEQMEVAFGKAIQQFSGKAEECIRILDGKLRKPLEDMDIGWGNRLEAQLIRYIPVLVACGGNLSEGLDAILAQKLLRKLKGRFDLAADDMVKLKARITSVWEAENQLSTGIPEQSVGLIETELRRLGGNI